MNYLITETPRTEQYDCATVRYTENNVMTVFNI